MRFAAPGWMLLLLPAGGGLILLAPLVVATVVGPSVPRRVVGRWRTVIAAMLGAMDLVLLTFAVTMPDITDNEDTNVVPVVRLMRQQGEMSKQTADAYSTIAGYAALCYLVAAAGVIVVSVARWLRARRAA